MSTQLQVAYLGPEGTYTHQAALTRFKDSATYVPYDTIANTLEAVHTGQVGAACIPLENSLHGSVIETWDLLREDWVGIGKGDGGVQILGECTIGIEHCLVVKRGVGMEDIRRVLSHEQALGQCHDYLSTHLPQATRVRTPSTASAAQQLLSPDPESLHSAAICSRACADVHEELAVLKCGIQDGEINFTRFIVLARGSLSDAIRAPVMGRALLRCVLPPRTQGVTQDTQEQDTSVVSLSSLIQNLPPDVLVMRVDRRPSLAGEPFHDCTFLEVVARPSADAGRIWEDRVKDAAKTVNAPNTLLYKL